jgi:MerR family transcriptional regulator, mercuric resistance operon regulatory protein
LGFRRRRASLSKTHKPSLENRADLVSKTSGKQLNKPVPLLSKIFARSAGRYRLYDTGDVLRLAFVCRARELGFTLDEVRALLVLSAANSENTYSEVRDLTARHLADVRAKIADLRAMESILSEAVRRCDTGGLPGCPLIDTLSTSAPLHLVARRHARNLGVNCSSR